MGLDILKRNVDAIVIGLFPLEVSDDLPDILDLLDDEGTHLRVVRVHN